MRNYALLKKHSNSGYTLVELIVVLVILGILASAAVFGISGYIDMTRFNRNQDNSLSIFQAAQAEINHLESSGTSEEFINLIMTQGTPNEYNSSNSDGNDTIFNKDTFNNFAVTSTPTPGESVHMRYSVTYTPGASDDQSNLIRSLIGDYFKATDIFDGIITIEFDIEKNYNAHRIVHYCANVYSVFCDAKRTAWDNTARNNLSLPVPYRASDYRNNTSLVGYSNTRTVAASAAVDNVILPNETVISDIRCYLRNSETLDLIWSATSDGNPITGVPAHIHYNFSLFDSKNNTRLCDLVVNENSILSGTVSNTLQADSFYDKLQFDKDHFTDNETGTATINGKNYTVVYTKETVKDRNGTNITIYKATITTIAKVYVNVRNNGATYDTSAFNYDALPSAILQTNNENFYDFPLTVSYEVHEGDGASDRITYALSLDCMMARNLTDESNTSLTKGINNYSISRLFSPGYGLETYIVPKNIYASMSVSPDNFANLPTDFSDNSGMTYSTLVYAQRALDDPVYKKADGTYAQSDTAVHADTFNRAVVNTYYGDLGAGSLGSDAQGTGGSAVITSCRHLYNISRLQNYAQPVTYTISRDLNWYEKITSGGTTTYSSEVKVFSASGAGGIAGYSPVPAVYGYRYGSILNVVSFPAIHLLPQEATLTAGINDLSAASDKTSVINNFQMRDSSFLPKDHEGNAYDAGFGLICCNNGNISNIRANGLTLTLDQTVNGSSDDTSSISASVTSLKTSSPAQLDQSLTGYSSVYVGGLIGLNKGIVGKENETVANTIALTDCTVFAGRGSGNSFCYVNGTSIGACGGVIGCNLGTAPSTDEISTFGKIEFTGSSSVAGYKNIGGIIGYNNSNIDAFLFVSSENTDTMVIAGANAAVGGAVGYSNTGKSFKQTTTPLSDTVDSYTGVVTMNAPAANTEFAIDVKLGSDSYIVSNSPAVCYGVGGAVGQISGYPNKNLNIRINNSGVLLNNGNSLGGAIGHLTGGTASQINIYVINSGKIGTANGSATFGTTNGTGGAIGRVENFGGDATIIRILSENKGFIYGNIASADINGGVGGAIGSVTNSAKPRVRVKTVNEGNVYGVTPGTTLTTETSIIDNINLFGVGGAVGLFTYVPKNSAIYCVMEENSSVHATGNNAGGAVGCERLPSTDLQTTTFTYVTDLHNGASITADFFNAGGASGNFCDLNYNTRLVTRVMDDGEVYIRAMGNAGGVTGRLVQTSGSDTYPSYLLLQGNDSSPILNVRVCPADGSSAVIGNENAGGLAGMTGSTCDFSAGMVIENKLTLKVDSYKNSGGAIGQMRGNLAGTSNWSLTIPTMAVNLSGASVVSAGSDNAGGAIGLLTNINTLTTAITVSSETGASISAGVENCGGCIGNAINNDYFKIAGSITSTGTGLTISGGSNVGGCIGTASSNNYFEIAGTVTSEVNNLTISGTTSVGGVFGKAESGDAFKIDGVITCKGDSTSVTGTSENANSTTAFKTNSGVGGCFGTIIFTKNDGDHQIEAQINYDCTNSSIHGKYNVGGIIGYAYHGSYSKDMLYKGTGNSIIADNDNVGGVIGYANCVRVDGHLNLTSGGNLTISGNDRVGGILGYLTGADNGYNNNYWVKQRMNFTVNGTGNTITGNGFTGGITGYNNQSQYSQSEVILNADAVLTVKSNNGYAGGHIGGMEDMIIGPGSGELVVTAKERSSFNINGAISAGGLVGLNDGKIGGRKLEIATKNGARVYVTSESGSAGGFIGVNNGALARNAAKTYYIITGGGQLHVSAGTYVGGVVGINNGIVGSINGNAWQPSPNTYVTFYLPTGVKLFLIGTTGKDDAIGKNYYSDPPPAIDPEKYNISTT